MSVIMRAFGDVSGSGDPMIMEIEIDFKVFFWNWEKWVDDFNLIFANAHPCFCSVACFSSDKSLRYIAWFAFFLLCICLYYVQNTYRHL